MTELTLKEHNHNLKYNLVHEFCWGFGISLHTIYAVAVSYTPLTLPPKA